MKQNKKTAAARGRLAVVKKTAPVAERKATRVWKSITVMSIAASLVLSGASPAWAYSPTGPGASESESMTAYDAETQARLEDNTLEYDELQMRVHGYNLSISEAWKTYNDTKVDYEAIITEMESQYRLIKETVEDYKDLAKLMAGTETAATLRSAGNTLNSTYVSTMQSFRDSVGEWDTNRVNTFAIRKAERQVTSGAQQAMIGYDTICSNIDTLQTLVELYEEQAAMTARQAELGMSTETEALSAKNSLLSAQSQLATLQAQQDSTRRTLLTLAGYDPNGDTVISRIPQFDMSRLDGMDLEADTWKAIGNNYTLIDQRTSDAGESTAQIANRLDQINEGDQKLTIEMQRLYDAVMDQKAAYEATAIGFSAAETTWKTAQSQYQLGMLSKLGLLGSEISYYQSRASLESANLSLLQAMESYDWGVAGLATVE
ncbi:MAG: TolC family protein [Clostridiales bacterium]|nr:TolC family protein [Clostridiales bacterium]